MRITVAITGASGTLYAVRLLRYLLMADAEVDCILSDAGRVTFKVEMDEDAGDLDAYLRKRFSGLKGRLREYPVDSISAPLASGSVARDGMVIIPCSMKTLSAVAHGFAGNLIERAADVCLKERYPLVVVPRETPMNSLQIRNMLTLSEAGALIVPAMPAFYQKPKSLDDIADFVAARVLGLLGIRDHGLFKSWGGPG